MAEDFQEDHWTAYHPNGQLHWQAEHRDGAYHGKFRVLDQSGALLSEANYHRGRLQGVFRSYHPDGKLAIECHYRANRLDGPYRRWHANGVPHLNACYSMNELHGEYTEADDQGKLTHRLLFAYGMPVNKGFARAPEQFPPPSRWPQAVTLAAFCLIATLVAYKAPAMLVAGIALMLTILIHETGHYLVAKLVGIPIRTFKVGGGPAWWAFLYNGTHFELGCIPLYGYVTPPGWRSNHLHHYRAIKSAHLKGEDPPPEPPRLARQPRRPAYELVSRPRQLAFMLGGVFWNVVAAALFIALSRLGQPAAPEPQVFIAVQTPEGTRSIPLDGALMNSQNRMVELNARLTQLAAELNQIQAAESTDARVAELEVEQRELEQQLRFAAQEFATLATESLKSTPRENTDVGPLEQLGTRLVSSGAQGAFQTFGLINLVIGVFNLLPIPPLDGFRCLELLASLVLRRELTRRWRLVVGSVTAVVVICYLTFEGWNLIAEFGGLITR